MLRPKPSELEKAWDTQTRIRDGVIFHCGHDFWDNTAKPGEVVYCSRCGQFFVKATELPWLQKIDKGPRPNVRDVSLIDHGIVYCPVRARLTTGY